MYDNRVFSEEYFMKRFGDGLPPEMYFLMSEKANIRFVYHKCMDKIKKYKKKCKSLNEMILRERTE